MVAPEQQSILRHVSLPSLADFFFLTLPAIILSPARVPATSRQTNPRRIVHEPRQVIGMSIAITVLFHNEKDFQHDTNFHVNQGTPCEQQDRQETKAAAVPHASFRHGFDGYAPLVTSGSLANFDNGDLQD